MSATISDSLFGLTTVPDSMQERLAWLAESLVELLSDGLQEITLEVSVEGHCPPRLREPVLRIADALVGHAVRHGMVARVIGRITVCLASAYDGWTTLLVTHDGWGPCQPEACEALNRATALTARHGGQLRLEQGSMISVRSELFDGGWI